MARMFLRSITASSSCGVPRYSRSGESSTPLSDFVETGDVRMEVDDGKFRTLDVGLVHLEHTPWLVLRKLQRRGVRLRSWPPHRRPCRLAFQILPPDPFHTATDAD